MLDCYNLKDPSVDKARPKDIKHLREQFLSEQQGLCAICYEPINENEAVLDHCHKTGQLRSVLHRGCNAFIGHLENNQARNKITPNRLARILQNFESYTKAQKPILHPTHKTPEEKAQRAKQRAKRRRMAKKKPL